MRVVILGAGVVGLTMANLLAQDTNLNITLIDSHQPQLTWDAAGYDLRCSAITRAAQNVFCYLNVWSDILAARVGVYEKMSVWDSNSNAKINFAAKDLSEEDLGHIIENRVMQRALWQKLQQEHRVSFIIGKANKIEPCPQYNRIYVNDLILEAQLIIGADGADSWLRQMAYIPTVARQRQQSALVAVVRSELRHERTARQVFTANGPIAFLPLDQPNLSSIVWSASSAKIQQLLTPSRKSFAGV